MRDIQNPWLALRDAPPYVLDDDREPIDRYNRSARPEHLIVVDSIPEPFIGNPNTARLVLLNLNPRHDEKNLTEHTRPAIKAALLRNLHQQPQDYPFYPFSPEFVETNVAEYWRDHTKALRAETKLGDLPLSQRLLVIEWFPYHSKNCGLKEKLCKSQEYCFSLARQMLGKDDVIVLGMRSRRFWDQEDKSFREIPYLNNARNPCISRRNMDPDLFDRIVQLLRKE